MSQRTLLTFGTDETTWVVPEGWVFLNDTPGVCRSCGARVLWLENKKSGKKSPFNPDGINHFATCPQADSWRKK